MDCINVLYLEKLKFQSTGERNEKLYKGLITTNSKK